MGTGRILKAGAGIRRYEGGSGLGLAIAKNRGEKHQGVISVASDDTMTSFQVRLPVQHAKQT